ncbi:MAG: hypothetical protein LBT59_10915, partial [Clostridiales bacterium]|nr:hypothetical protein [Clostridiales bacterium]
MTKTKRIASLALAISFLLAFPIQSRAEYQPFSEELGRFYYAENYYDDVWSNYTQYVDNSVWPILANGSNAYLDFAKDLDGNAKMQSVIKTADWLTEPSFKSEKAMLVERDIDVLVSFLYMMDYDLNKTLYELAETDAIKAVPDTEADIAVAQAAIRAKAGTLLKEVADSAAISFRFDEAAVEDMSDYKRLTTTIKDYEMFRSFLTSIITYSGDDNLKQAAKKIRDCADKALELKLDYLSKQNDAYAENPLVDIFFSDIILDPTKWDTQSDKDFIEGCKEIYEKTKQSIDVSMQYAVLSGDMLPGASSMLNRVNEIRVMALIQDALVKDMAKNKPLASRANFKAIDKAFDNMRFLMFTNSRGDHCLSELAQQDPQALGAWPANHNAEVDHKKFMNLLLGESGFYPNMSQYKKAVPDKPKDPYNDYYYQEPEEDPYQDPYQDPEQDPYAVTEDPYQEP